MKKITKVCDKCGSEDVYYDALAKWDYRKQDWVLGEDFWSPWCEQCDAGITIEDKEDNDWFTSGETSWEEYYNDDREKGEQHNPK